MSLLNCFDRARQMGILSAEEAAHFKKRFRELSKEITDSAEVRARMAKEVEAEAKHRERAAIMTEIARVRIEDTIRNYRNLRGEVDLAEAFRNLHENFGRGGSFVQDAENRREVLIRSTMAEMKEILHEMRRGAFTGDLRRSVNKNVRARMDNFVRELFGENTGDAKASSMARAWEKVSEDLRVRFNGAGGNVAKLERWGLPQSHDALALMSAGRDEWVKYMMRSDVLDRERTVHPVSGLKMTDAELKEALQVIWERITTDGWSDRDVTAFQGKGAVYTQHADHRFLHFKNADAWLAYAKRFGNPDAFSAIMGHVSVMARDIAHMEVFGPNPNRMREHFKALITQEAAKTPINEIIIRNQQEELERLQSELVGPNPEHERRAAEAAAISKQIRDLYSSREGRRYEKHVRALMKWEHAEDVRAKTRPDEAPSPRPELPPDLVDLDRRGMDLSRQLGELEAEMRTMAKSMPNPEIEAQIEKLIGEMRDPIRVADRKKPEDALRYVNRQLARADEMWMDMRGMQPRDPKIAERMQSVRSWITGASLGSAWLSSISDPAFGQDTRRRFGMSMAQANFGRIIVTVIKDMITMNRRDDAIEAMLGLDSAMRVLRKKADEIRGIDHRFWSDWVADRVLTTGLLSPWTQAGKHAVGFDLMTYMGKLTSKAWAELPDLTRAAMETHGFDAQSWDRIRKVETKAGQLRPTEIRAADRELGERYLQMILRETRYAVPESTIASRSMFMSKAEAGTYAGELIRSAMQFKGFGVAVVMLHAGRIAREMGAGNVRQPLGQAAALLVTSSFLGAIAMALKDIKDGRDPRKWLDEKTYLDWTMWGAAALQAGGLGIYGDFLFSEVNRFGGGIEKTVAGPLIGRAGDVLELASQPLLAAKGEKTKAGAKAVDIARNSTPFVNHWAISAAMQRMVFDRLHRIADPEAQAAFNRAIQKRQKDYGQKYFWRPGTTAPQRSPDIGRIFATR